MIIFRHNQVSRATCEYLADSAESAVSINVNLINALNRGLPPISGIVRRKKKDETSPHASVGLISLLINHVVWYMSITRLHSGGAHGASFLQDDYFRNYSSLSEMISISFFLFLFLSPVLSRLRSFEARSQILHCRYFSIRSIQQETYLVIEMI